MKVTLLDVAGVIVANNSPNPDEQAPLPLPGDLMTLGGVNLSALNRAGELEFDLPVTKEMFAIFEKLTKPQ